MAVPDPQPDLALTGEQADRLVAAWLGDGASCTGVHRLTGGMVNSVFRLDVDRPPHHAVVKLHEPGGDDFAAEARALRHLRAETALPVPGVHRHDGTAATVPYAVLLLEHLPGVCLDGLQLEPEDRADLDRQLGHLLVGLHHHTGPVWGGLDGPAPEGSWPAVMEARLRSVRARPTVAARLEPDVLARIDAAIDRAPAVLGQGPAARPTLVHGDVWNGNLLVDRRDGRWLLTGLLDPTAEYADPEMELAYLEVFDQPRPALREVYDHHWPPRPGHERRRLVYWLHTALLHVALFELEVFRGFAAQYADDLLTA